MQTKERKRRVPSVLEASIYLLVVIAVVVAGIRLGSGKRLPRRCGRTAWT